MEFSNIRGSFRDPSGFLFIHDDEIYRQINIGYKDDYDLLMSSGLYEKLVSEELLIPHVEVDLKHAKTDTAYKIIKPEIIDFISYPYEWSFSQLKDAALATINIQKIAMEYGMSLKDSSAYNIQFRRGKPVLIDTLSFEKYEEGKPWVAYKQFCQHFLAPLALISFKDVRLSQLSRVYIDGIPLDLASKILPFGSRFNFSLLMNIHLHAKSQDKYASKPVNVKEYRISRTNLLALLSNLESTVKKMKWLPKGTEWGDYYNMTNYSDDSFQHKAALVEKFFEKTNARSVWDLGANTGVFSRIASNKGVGTIAFDIDPVAVEKNYLQCVRNHESKILPLILDLANPSSDIGWNNEERMSFKGRGLPDTVFALALIHHLAISNNLPLGKIAKFFSEICKYLIIEFVPKSDSQVKKLLSTREDIFDEYNKECFEREFKKYFEIECSEIISGSERTLYLLRRNI
jgi:hypothetical protein